MEKQLSKAIKENNLEKVKKLINEGVNVNATYKYTTPLCQAIFCEFYDYRELDIIECLLENGADINMCGSSFTPLHHAVTSSYPIVKYLVEKKANVNLTDVLRRTPLHEAVIVGDLSIITYLTNHGANWSIKDYFGSTPFDLITMSSEKVFDSGSSWTTKQEREQIRAEKLFESRPNWNPYLHHRLTTKRERDQIQTLMLIKDQYLVLLNIPDEIIFKIFDMLVE